MGWIKLFLNANNAEGCREAMRMSYKKHYRLANKAFPLYNEASPHYTGLFGALGSRYQTFGLPVVEGFIWAELVPFLLMSEKEAVEALAEYVVYKERPSEAKLLWLKKIINDSLQTASSSEESPRSMAAMGIINNVSWCGLLEPNIKNVLESEARNMIPSSNQGRNQI